jgi:gluconolactonase
MDIRFLFQLTVTAWILLAPVPESALAEEANPIPRAVGPIQRIAAGFSFTEGPVADDSGEVYFTDIPNNRIYRLTSSGKRELFTDQSNHANGLMFDAEGELLACEMDGRLVAWNVKTKKRRVVADSFGGERFNAPNDLITDKQGGIYFTDPHYMAPKPLPQGTQAVYYVAPNRGVNRVVGNLSAPNGILLSRDESTLYVLPSDDRKMLAFAITKPGQVGAARTFCELVEKEPLALQGCDGAALDKHGNLYLTTVVGVEIFNSDGQRQSVVKIPEQPSNVCFGGTDFKTMYVTARTSLYSVPMNVAGYKRKTP